MGQVIRRDESDNRPNTGDPHEIWFRFDGRELGHVSNNGTLETDYATSVANRTAAQGTGGAFRNGAATGASVAEFGSDFQPINSYDQGSPGGTYTVRNGDTLQSIAQRLYGDETLWYKIAQANGLSTDSQLVEGQILTLPRGVVRSANSATTFRPYDPNAVVGDIIPDETSPTQPQPQARRRRNRCGVFGAILLAVVAVVVTVATVGTFTSVAGPILGGALAAAAGSVASQAVGVATGIQDRFSFKGVALSALAGGVGAGVGQIVGNGSVAGSSFLGDVARGAAGAALTQGVATVTGLQSRFDFAGVAAAGIGAGVGGAAGRGLRRAGAGSFATQAGRATASGIASAASLSIVNGDSFGDNLVRALPQVVAQTVGGTLEDARQSAMARQRAARASPDGMSTDAEQQNGGASGQSIERRSSQRAEPSATSSMGERVNQAASVTGDGEASTTGSEVVVVARRDTYEAIRYLDYIGRYNSVESDARNLGLTDTSSQNAYFRQQAYYSQTQASFLRGASTAFDLLPGVGTAKGVAQLITGRDLFTGETIDRRIEAAGLALGAVPLERLARFGASSLRSAAYGSTSSAAERVAIGEGGAASRFTFRGDSRSPDVIFNEGFAPRGSSTDLLAHAFDNTLPPSAYVSTSKSASVAGGFADNVYVVRSTNGIDVNRVLGPASPFPNELEIAIPGRVLPGNVRGVTIPNRGMSILNPNYKP